MSTDAPSSADSNCTVTPVDFAGAHGTRLRGDLYLPSGKSGPYPAVAMAHGFSATRRMGLPGFARCFADAGVAVLLYDHRNLGDSEGEPRQLINPWAQARDYRYALTWLAQRPEVDADRLGIWGSSYSGGQVLVVGAIDERVKVVIANAPFSGISRDALPAAEADERFEAIRRGVADESGAGPADAGDLIGPMAVVDENGGPCFLPQPESARWFLNVGGHPDSGWQNTLTLQSGGGDVVFDPGVCVPRVAPTALLMVVASEDRLAPTDIAITSYSRAGQPKRLELLDGDHFVDYEGAAFDKACATMREFLLEHL